MATTYSSSKVATTVTARGDLEITCQSATYTTTAAIVINDVIQMVKVPKGATVLDLYLDTTDLDSNGAPAITMSVGDGNSTARYINATTIGRTGGFIGPNAATQAVPYTYTSEDTIDVTFPAAPATYAAGTIKLVVFYTMQQ